MPQITPPGLSDAARLLREAARDEFVACLLVPQPQREHMFTLLALAHQLRGIPEHVTEPMMGRIRYQWWRDQFSLIAKGETPARHELTDGLAALGQGIAQLADAATGFEALLDKQPPASMGDALGEAAARMTPILQLLANTDTPPEAVKALAAGLELSHRYRRSLVADIAAGHVFLPLDALAAQRLSPEKLRDFRPGAGFHQVLLDSAIQLRNSLPARRQLSSKPLRLLHMVASRRLGQVIACKGDFTHPQWLKPDSLLVPALWLGSLGRG